MRHDCIKIYCIVILLCICVTIGFAQAPNTLWTKTIDKKTDNYSHHDFGYEVQQTADGGYIVVGQTISWPTASDIYLVKLASEYGVAEKTENNAPQFSISIFPNPFGDKIEIRCVISDNSTVDLKIYDITGRLVKDFSGQLSVIGYQSSVIWDGRDDFGKKLPSGTYLLKFSAGDYRETKKLVLLK